MAVPSWGEGWGEHWPHHPLTEWDIHCVSDISHRSMKGYETPKSSAQFWLSTRPPCSRIRQGLVTSLLVPRVMFRAELPQLARTWAENVASLIEIDRHSSRFCACCVNVMCSSLDVVETKLCKKQTALCNYQYDVLVLHAAVVCVYSSFKLHRSVEQQTEHCRLCSRRWVKC